MAYTYTWDSSFEALPADANNVSDGANKIRNLKNALRERMAKDHYMAIAGTDADHGEHSQVTFHANVATPANLVGKSTLFPQTANSKLELFYKDNANQVTQITANGAVATSSVIPANTKMLFYADTAPAGWTIANTMDDKLVFVTKGNAAGGQTGGGAHSTANWNSAVGLTAANENAHVHAGPLHAHSMARAANTGDASVPDGYVGASSNLMVTFPIAAGPSSVLYDYTNNNAAANTGAGSNHTHSLSSNSAWRPSAYCFIVCTKN